MLAAGATAQDFDTGQVKGTYILDHFGQLYANGEVGSATYEGVFFGQPGIEVDIEITPTGGGLWLLDAWGGLHTPQGNGAGGGGNDALKQFIDPTPADETDSSYAPYFGVPVAVDMECIPQAVPSATETWGLFILDNQGGVHAVGAAAAVQVASLELAPYFGFDIARDLELTATGGGYFILDGYGAVHAVGDALDQIPSPMGFAIPYFGFDIAKDLELITNQPLPATPETGWYLLDGMGGLHTMGLPAIRSGDPEDNVYITEAMQNIYFYFDMARDFEIMSDSVAVTGDETYFQLDGSGGIHPRSEYPFALEDGNGDPLHYFMGMNVAVDMEYLRER
ncbi:hypothetical protein HS125_05985 [bacterium]|nr:hypothetical protein [bacterium]